MSPVPVPVPAARPRPRPVADRPLRSLRPVPLRVVGDVAPVRRRGVVGLGAAAIAVFILSLLGMAAFHAVLVTGQVRLDELQGAVAEEQSRYSSLRLEVAKLQAPGHVVKAAQELGMVPPGAPPAYLAPTNDLADEVAAASAAAEGVAAEDESSTAAAARTWETVKPYLGDGQ